MITALHQVFGRKYGNGFPDDYIFAYDFKNSLLDKKGVRNLTPQNTSYTFGTDDKGNANSAIVLSSTGLSTNINLAESPIWTISCKLKTNQTSQGHLIECGQGYAYNSNNGFRCSFNEVTANKMTAMIRNTDFNLKTLNDSINDNNWHHIIIEYNRTEPASTEIKIYVDNTLRVVSTAAGYNTDSIGNFGANPFVIGARYVGGSPLYFVGSLCKFYGFSRLLTTEEKTILFNE